ncbi:thiamine diphosphokinase [Metabacillus fastidiosus]|uniref:thiamine diphosphokinase n=1 Tax=Metabacillus fastidiosus TaxID=1458 RepID=UPI003D2C9B34
MKRKYALVAGGPKAELADLKAYEDENVRWIGIDRGVLFILEAGFTLHHAFGDFDSVTMEEKKKIERETTVSIYPAEKDATDTEIALNWVLEQTDVEEIYLFGATGGRLDHFFANVQLLINSIEKGTKITIIDSKNQITLFKPGTYKVVEQRGWKYISFVPISEDVYDLTLTGFKYPLSNEYIKIGSTLCISNEFAQDECTFSFTEGILMMIRSKD